MTVLPSVSDAALALLLMSSGGKPVVQIVLDDDGVAIRGAGLDEASIPDFLWRLACALTGRSTEPVPAAQR